MLLIYFEFIHLIGVIYGSPKLKIRLYTFCLKNIFLMMLRVEILKLPLGKTGGKRKRDWNLELEWSSNLSSSKNGLKLFDFSELQFLFFSKRIVFTQQDYCGAWQTINTLWRRVIKRGKLIVAVVVKWRHIHTHMFWGALLCYYVTAVLFLWLKRGRWMTAEKSWASESEGKVRAHRWRYEGAILRSVRSIHALFLFADPLPSLPWGQFLVILLSLGRLLPRSENRRRERNGMTKSLFPECAVSILPFFQIWEKQACSLAGGWALSFPI